MQEGLKPPVSEKGRMPKNPAKLLMRGWQMIRRRDQLGQIAYVNTRLRQDYSNCDGNVSQQGHYAIEAEQLEDGSGLRRITYARRREQGQLSVRRVTIINDETLRKTCDIEHMIVDDMALDGSETVSRTYAMSEGLASQTDFPFRELEQELTEVYKDAKPHIWPGDPFLL